MHTLLGRGASQLVALQVEDILEVKDQPNLPGTIDSYPNWRRPLPVAGRDLGSDAAMLQTGRLMQRLRP